jgi:hypothetical protein
MFGEEPFILGYLLFALEYSKRKAAQGREQRGNGEDAQSAVAGAITKFCKIFAVVDDSWWFRVWLNFQNNKLRSGGRKSTSKDGKVGKASRVVKIPGCKACRSLHRRQHQANRVKDAPPGR